MKLNYTKINDYEIPNVVIEDKNKEKINKYGLLKLHYLKENNKSLYTTLLMKDKLTNNLISVSKQAEERFNILMKNCKNNDEKLSETSKESNQLEWVKLINNYKNMAEEIILKELIYTENV